MALDDVLRRQVFVDEAMVSVSGSAPLEDRDRAFAVNIVLTSLRRLGEIDAVLARYLAKPLPGKSGLALAVLRTAAAQLLFLDTPAHAAVGLAVETARADREGRHFAGVINAVLRKVSGVSATGKLEPEDASSNTPPWLWNRWVTNYGEETARRMARAHLDEPSIDIAVRSSTEHWAEVLSAVVLLDDHLRLPRASGAIPALPGFDDGAWWVQDVAASLPVRLMGDVRGKRVADLCAAPGGKTMQLCSRGAIVTSVDSAVPRMERLSENLGRMRMQAELVFSDIRDLGSGRTFDAVLLDAPCSATGTIRRHPEIPHVRREADVLHLARQQAELLQHAATLTAPGGMLVFSTCSLEPEEGEQQIERFIQGRSDFRICRDWCNDGKLPAELVDSRGFLRTLPHQSIGGSRGMDGFFAAALRRTS